MMKRLGVFLVFFMIGCLAGISHVAGEARHTFDGATALMLMTCRNPVGRIVLYHDGSCDKGGEYYYDAADVTVPEFRKNMLHNIRPDVSVSNFIASRDTAVALMEFLKKSDDEKVMGCRYVTSGLAENIAFCLFESGQKLPSKHKIADIQSKEDGGLQSILSEFIAEELISDGKYEFILRPIYHLPFMKVSPENIAYWEIGFIEATGGSLPRHGSASTAVQSNVSYDVPDAIKDDPEKSALYHQKYEYASQLITEWIRDVEDLNLYFGN